MKETVGDLKGRVKELEGTVAGSVERNGLLENRLGALTRSNEEEKQVNEACRTSLETKLAQLTQVSQADFLTRSLLLCSPPGMCRLANVGSCLP